MPDIRVQDAKGTIHIFPDGSTPEMIAKAMNVKPPSASQPAAPDAIAQARQRVASIIPDQTFAQRLQSGGNPGSFEGHPENVGEYIPATAGNVASGVKDISQGNVARGTHKVISGAGNAFLPALPFVAAAGPAAFAKVAAMGAGGSYLGSNVAEGMGATPDQADVAGDVGGLTAGIFGPKALTATKGAIGDAFRTPYGPTSGASALKPGVKAVASVGKYVGGPELADWMVPERSAGPTGPYSRLPGRLPTALRGDPFSPEVPAVEPELGSPENPGWMSKIPSRMPKQAVVTVPKPSPFGGATPTNAPVGSAELPPVPEGNATPFPEVQKAGVTPTASRIVSPTAPEPRFSGSEGRAATWTNQDVMRLAQQGNREAIQQAVRRGIQLPSGARYVMGDPDFSRAVYSPREVTKFTPEGTPIRNLDNPSGASARQRVVSTDPFSPNSPEAVPQGNPSPFAPPQDAAYRAHTTGAPEIDPNAHAHATASPEEAAKYAEHRNEGVNQKVSRIDLNRFKSGEVEVMEGPNGSKWYKFNRPLTSADYLDE